MPSSAFFPFRVVRPYNCVFDGKGDIKGVIDFDGARLGPRNWDLSYAIYRFVPFVNFAGPDDGFGDFSNCLCNGVLGSCIPKINLSALFHHLCLGVLLRWLLAENLKLRPELGAAVELFINGTAVPLAAATQKRARKV